MKHSVFLKTIAIILCAASLLGLVGSGVGICVMVGLDLYDQTADQYIEDEYRSDSEWYAQVLAHRYAGRELGGLPENFLEDHYSGWYYRCFESGGFGYAILDSDGNVLESENEALRSQSPTLYSFPIEGNYMHLVSAKPVEENADIYSQGLTEGEYGIIDNVGEGTVPVYFIQISYNGGSEGIGSPTPLGFLARLGDGSVQFQANDPFSLDFTGDTEITRITFKDMDEKILYEVADEHPVAIITAGPEGGQSIHLLKENEEPVAIQMGTPVYKAVFYGPDLETPVESLSGSQPIGVAQLDENGMLDFQLFLESINLKNAGNIAAMVLMDQNGNVLFGQAQPQLQTSSPVITPDGMTFFSDPNAVAVAMPAETAPVETVPETAAAAEADAEAAEPAQTSGEEASAEPAEQAADTSEPEPVDLPVENTIPVETMPPETVPVETTLPAIVLETTPPVVVEAIPEETEPGIINGKPLDEYDISDYTYYDQETEQHMQAQVVYLPMPEYTVEIFFLPEMDHDAPFHSLLRLLYQYNDYLIPLLLGSLVLLALTSVYLCVAAGHHKNGEVQAAGLNRMPLDLYLLLDGAAIIGLAALVLAVCEEVLPRNMMISLVLIPLFSYAICLVFVGFCFALVAQCKTPGGYWWRNSLCGRILTGGVGSLEKGTDWTVKKFFPWLWKVICKFWDICLFLLEKCWKCIVYLWRKLVIVWDKLAICTKTFGRWLFKLIRRAIDMLPLTWQWMLGGALLLLLGLLVWANRRDGWGILWLLVGFAMILYLSQCFGILLGAAKRMNKGDLETKLNDKRMVGCFREFAEDLNNLADVVVVAAQKEMRSERMKTELITNVSHDIKTPLTSIINYVDLLQKPHTEEEGVQYLEVLDRQSQQLKKLIDDLMDMSKANTGNMHVEITRLDAVESVNQALGEFADKLEKAELYPVFRHNTPEAFIMADGKLVWRVLSNLLGNAVKYAMPGTRLYLDLMNLDGRVILSLKNISRDELNVDSEELMERFVRGDDARNTEGSGLGLNIAKSLMELQKGHLQLLVDGDLFKVTLVFPTAE